MNVMGFRSCGIMHCGAELRESPAFLREPEDLLASRSRLEEFVLLDIVRASVVLGSYLFLSSVPNRIFVLCVSLAVRYSLK